MRILRPVLLSCVVLLPWLSIPPAAAGGDEVERLGDFQAVIETAKRRVYPALVFLKPVQEDLSAGEARRVEILGSGVIFRPDGHVVTNHHVAEKAREIRCVLGDRRQVEAKVVGLDKLTDLAVLKLDLPEGETVPYADFGSAEGIEEGQFVLALGSPYGFERSISLGIVSNARRHLDSAGHPYNNWIQTDAAINPGNSGGPLVNTKGEVIGINTLAIRRADNLGFAVPVNVVKRVVDRLLKDGHVERARHGLTLRALVDYEQNTIFEGDEGVIVDDVAGSSAAEKAGLQKGDRILAIAGHEVQGRYMEDLPEIRWQLADLVPDEPVRIDLRRGEEELTVTLTPTPSVDLDDEGLECDRWDATFQSITLEDKPGLHFYRPTGVYVLGVSYPGNAAASGLRSGDIVLRVNNAGIESLGDLQAMYEQVLEEERPKKLVLFEVLRNGYLVHIALDYGPDYDREK